MRTISSSSIGPRFIGRSVPLTRMIGGRSAFKCKSLPLSLTKARNNLSISSSSYFLMYFDATASGTAVAIVGPRSVGLALSGWAVDWALSCSGTVELGAVVLPTFPESANGNAPFGHHAFRFLNRILAKVKNAGRQRRVGLPLLDGVGQVFRLAGPAAGHDRNRHRLADRRRDRQIIAVLGAVGVH